MIPLGNWVLPFPQKWSQHNNNMSFMPPFITALCVSYGMVCVSIWEDNPRTLAGGLSHIQMHRPYNFLITPVCICSLCLMKYMM